VDHQRRSPFTAQLRQKFLWRQAQFVFEWLQPRILLSGSPSPTGGSPEVENPTYVSSSPPTVADPAAAISSTVTGATANLSVLGADANGEASLTYTWATTGSPPAPVTFSSNGTTASKDVTATLSRAGNYTLQVTITDAQNLSTTSSVNVTVLQTATFIVVTPTSSTLNVNQQKQFTAVEYDQFGQAMAQQPSFTWALASGDGSITSSGLYTAPLTVGSAQIVASAGSLSAFASVTIQNTGPQITQAAAGSPSTITGTSTTLSISATDNTGSANLIYQWSVVSKPAGVQSPLLSVNGTTAASPTVATFFAAGTYEFQATVTDSDGLSATSDVMVQVNQTLTSIQIAPPSTMSTSSTQQLAATSFDQFGNAMAAQPSLTWSASGGGSVSSP
jgi:hypothetical protein